MILGLRRMVLFGVVVVMSLRAPLHGDPGSSVPELSKRRLAKQYVAAGLTAQGAGDYDAAIAWYEKAYQLAPHPVLIFNIAQANRLSGQLEQALAGYERYLSIETAGPEAQTAREFIAEIKTKLFAQRASVHAQQGADAATAGRARRTSGAPAGIRAVQQPSTERPAERQQPGSPVTEGSLARQPAQAPRPGDKLVTSSLTASHAPASDASPTMPLILTAGSVVLLAAGVSVYLWGRSTYREAQDEQTNQARRDSLYDSANDKRHLAMAITGAGLACGGVAAWLYFTRHDEHAGSMAAARILPVFGQASLGAAVVGWF